jgi:predicted nucleic acid-binding protein
MLVVSNTTPLNALVQTGDVEILPRLFQRVIIPTAIAEELFHPSTPPKVYAWLTSKPAWLEIRNPTRVDTTLPLDRGEVEAIALTKECKADLLLLDERRARREAARLGLPIVGTLGVIELAARARLLDLEQAIERLRQTNFRIREVEIARIRERHATWTQTQG